ncbi:hypothetical protein PAMP_002838 [Pampus punctatissimus]
MASDTVTDCTVETAAQRREEGTPPVEQVSPFLSMSYCRPVMCLCSIYLVTNMVCPQQLLKDVDGRLVTLSDKINLCNRVLEDLKDLSDLVVRKSFQDVSLPQLK